MTKKKKILVFSLFTLTFAAAAILDIFSQSSFWKKTTKTKKKKTIQLKEEEEKPNPRGSTSTLSSPPSPGPDRISELPKEILVHILGFLEMDELLIGTSLVSTKWRYLWKSVSNLNFPTCTVATNDTRKNNVEIYQNFVDHVLRLRDSEASKIRIFKYYCKDFSSSRDYLERVHNSIVSAAVNQGAQEIQITMGIHSGRSSELRYVPQISLHYIMKVMYMSTVLRTIFPV